MSFPSQFDALGISEFDRQEEALRGREISLICEFQDSRDSEIIQVALGQDVAYAKMQLCRRLDLEYHTIQMFLNGQLMFDPLSFSDFDFIQNNPTDSFQIKIFLS